MLPEKFTGFLFELFFPKFCLGCQKEGSYLCPDCQATLEILKIHQHYSSQNLKDLYFALPYQAPLIKKLIQKFKYEPFVKKLANPLSSLIIEHFQLLDNRPSFIDFTPHHFPDNEITQKYKINQKEYPKNGAAFIIIPVPLEKRKLKWRGFNQAEEISKELSSFLRIPLIPDCLTKIRETTPQVKLTKEERKENIKEVFSVKNNHLIKNKKILLVDDVYTTGATMEETAKVLKMAGAKEIIGIAIARAKPEDDRFQNM